MLLIRPEHLDAITNQANQFYPEEVCGFLIGTDCENANLQVSRVVASDNVTALDRTKHFEINPELRLRLMVELRELSDNTLLQTKHRIIGHYHSHPNGNATPSKTDLEMAWEPELIWLICGLKKDDVREFKAYKLSVHAQNFIEVEIDLGSSETYNLKV